jgi:Cdc6-like AAA superfamily ATPase
MIRDARALRDEFVPQELQHRNSEIDHISSCPRPIEEDVKGDHVLITAPVPGRQRSRSTFANNSNARRSASERGT